MTDAGNKSAAITQQLLSYGIDKVDHCTRSHANKEDLWSQRVFIAPYIIAFMCSDSGADAFLQQHHSDTQIYTIATAFFSVQIYTYVSHSLNFFCMKIFLRIINLYLSQCFSTSPPLRKQYFSFTFKMHITPTNEMSSNLFFLCTYYCCIYNKWQV